MYQNFVKNNGIFILDSIFKDYLGTQFFPSKFLCNSKYDFNEVSSIFINSFNKNNINNLYIHIPFCKTKCFYCHCYTYVSDKYTDQYEKYIDYLIKELKIIISFSNTKIKLNSIFIGGGTPNIIGAKNLSKLFEFINNEFDLKGINQYNIDLNPYCLTYDTIKLLGKYKVNRCTYAIQSFNIDVLRVNSRFYDESTNHFDNINLLKENGLEVNIDLMVGIKDQTFDICKTDIDKSIKLGASNISLNYFIQSSNVEYKIDSEGKNLIYKVKKYYNKIINNNYNKSDNFQEETYLKEKVNLIGAGNGAISHLTSGLIGYNNFTLENYYSNIENKIIYSHLKILDDRIELIKYLFFNLVFGIDINYLKTNFSCFDTLDNEINFLIEKNILKKENNILSSNTNNFKLYLYLTIFIKDYFDEDTMKTKDYDEFATVFNLKKFFLNNGEKIDEDY